MTKENKENLIRSSVKRLHNLISVSEDELVFETGDEWQRQYIEFENEDEWQRQHDEVSFTIRRVMMAIVIYCLFCVLTLGAPDIYLIANNSQIKIPFADTEVAYSGFLIAGPLILLAMWFYLQVFVDYHYKLGFHSKRTALPFVFNVNNSTSRKLSFFLLNLLPSFIVFLFAWKASPREGSEWLLSLAGFMLAYVIFLRIRRYNVGMISDGKQFSIYLSHFIGLILLLVLSIGAITTTALNINRPLSLFKADLKGLDLKGANFKRALMHKADLTKSNLTKTDFSYANLQQAKLNEVHSIRANFRNADLTKASLHKALLANADLTEAKLSSVNLKEADLTRSKLNNANLYGSNLSNSELLHADLTDTNLQNVNLSKSTLFYADLTGADLTKSRLENANLKGADLTEANLTQASLRGAKLKGVDLTRANLRMADLYMADLRHSNITCVQVLQAKSWRAAILDDKLNCSHEGKH